MNPLQAHFLRQPYTWTINLGSSSVSSIDMLAAAGAHCVFIDCERTAIHIESIRPLVLAAKSHGLFTMLRSENQQAETLIRYLDRGIDAIVVPHTETLQELEMIAQIIDYVSRGNPDQFMAIAQIESVAAVENIEALTKSLHVNSFLIGPNDLSHSMGLKGDLKPPQLWTAIDTVIEQLQASQRIWGIPAEPDSRESFSKQGAKFMYCTLQKMIHQGFKTYQPHLL